MLMFSWTRALLDLTTWLVKSARSTALMRFVSSVTSINITPTTGASSPAVDRCQTSSRRPVPSRSSRRRLHVAAARARRRRQQAARSAIRAASVTSATATRPGTWSTWPCIRDSPTTCWEPATATRRAWRSTTASCVRSCSRRRRTCCDTWRWSWIRRTPSVWNSWRRAAPCSGRRRRRRLRRPRRRRWTAPVDRRRTPPSRTRRERPQWMTATLRTTGLLRRRGRRACRRQRLGTSTTRDPAR